MWYFLALESSCDDTSAAVLAAEEKDAVPRVLALSVQSQNEVHEKFGGVVPELASRAHLRNLLPCIRKVLEESGKKLSDMDAFIATERPGLIGSLIVGHSAAKTFAAFHAKPFISVNHIEGHICSALIDSEPEFPFLALVASGGHTSLFQVNSIDDFQSIGVTLDDAIGEAYDKGAKLLGLGFPGGPQIDRIAKLGDENSFRFGKVKTPDLNFSFSGIKSELVRLVKKLDSQLDTKRADLAASFQKALLEHLFDKLELAASLHGSRRLAIVGGVASNSKLREILSRSPLFESVYFPELKFCTDNAAMIGVRGFRKFLKHEFSDLQADVGSTSRPSIRSRT